MDRAYLVAMSADDGPSRTGEVARRLNRSPQYAGVYRQRLLEAGLIVEAGRGRVAFVMPAMRDYLRAGAPARGTSRPGS
jgi:hypothetical protein